MRNMAVKMSVLIWVQTVCKGYQQMTLLVKRIFQCLSYKIQTLQPGPEVIKLFPCSTQLSMKFILLINIKKPTIVGILTFISMVNTTSERLKARNFFIYWYFSFYEQLKFHAQLSIKKVL